MSSTRIAISYVHLNIKRRCVSITNISRRKIGTSSIFLSSPRDDGKGGLILSEDQIERLWNSFKVVDSDNNKFDIGDFLKEYPHINTSLANKIKDIKENHTPKDDGEMTSHMNAIDCSQNFIVVEEAEGKLLSMFSKVKSQETIASSTKKDIQLLLMEELETVIQLWISLANSGGQMDNQEAAMFALDRAKALLLLFEAEYVKELRAALEYEDDSELILIAPHTINYQRIISAYYNIYKKKERSIARNDLVQIQSHCSDLLTKMMKHIISRRMQALESRVDTENSQNKSLLIEKRGHFSLNATYKQLISMYTSKIHLVSYTEAVDMAISASNLHQEMELYYHDFFTVSSPSTENQKFLLSIHPTRQTFNGVIQVYARIATKFKCSASAKKALDVINRMNKRYQAYQREGGGPDTNKGIVSPNLSSFRAVIGAFASLEKTTTDDLELIEKTLNVMNQYDHIKIDDSISKLVEQCWFNCEDVNKKDRFYKCINLVLSNIE